MPDTQALEALLARVEGATGPSHDIDDAILRVLGFTWRGMDYCHHDGKTVMKGSPFLTSSLDAIVALIERELPEHWWRTSRTWAELHHPMTRVFDAESKGATAPLALCAAFLRAKLAIERQP